MVTMQQIQRGLTRFVDNDWLVHYTDIKHKIGFGGLAVLYIEAMPQIVRQLVQNPMVSVLDIEHDGQYDIDKLYNAFVVRMGGGDAGLPVH
ncbi:MAG: hypothetical protein IKW19_04975, partial [Akkermansia sp.]|nr:hypothetical protein [Akkermansia sp.]